MTKEELRKEAREYVGSKSCDTDDYSCGFLPSTVEEMLIEFAEPREKRIAELEKENAELQDKLKNLASVAEVRLANWQKYEKENAELKILVSSMLYEINALWDISEMNEDVRKHAERINSEVEKC